MKTEATEAHRITPGWPDRSAWTAALVRDGRVGPAALAVAPLIAASEYRRTWPEFALSSKNIGRRLDLPLDTVVAVAEGLSKLGYVVDTGRLAHGGPRHLLRAILPSRLEVAPDQKAAD